MIVCSILKDGKDVSELVSGIIFVMYIHSPKIGKSDEVLWI